MKKILTSCFLLLTTGLLYSQGVLQGKLIFSNANVAKGYQVVIVPNTPANEQITNNQKFVGDNSQQLKQMNAQVAFTTNEGIYYFKGLPAGKYILKVCILNGYKYNFVINDNNYKLMAIKDLPATY